MKQPNEIDWDRIDKVKFFTTGFGAFSSVLTLLYPLNVIKTHQQTAPASQSTLLTTQAIWKSKGILGFYRGYATAVFGTVPSRMVYLTSLEYMKTTLNNAGRKLEISETTLAGTSNFIAAGIASCATQLISVPVDVIAQRQMVYQQRSSSAPPTTSHIAATPAYALNLNANEQHAATDTPISVVKLDNRPLTSTPISVSMQSSLHHQGCPEASSSSSRSTQAPEASSSNSTSTANKGSHGIRHPSTYLMSPAAGTAASDSTVGRPVHVSGSSSPPSSSSVSTHTLHSSGPTALAQEIKSLHTASNSSSNRTASLPHHVTGSNSSSSSLGGDMSVRGGHITGSLVSTSEISAAAKDVTESMVLNKSAGGGPAMIDSAGSRTGMVASRNLLGVTGETAAGPSALSIARSILREEGMTGFYRGFGASIALFVPASAVWWGCYGLYQKVMWNVLVSSSEHQTHCEQLDKQSGRTHPHSISAMPQSPAATTYNAADAPSSTTTSSSSLAAPPDSQQLSPAAPAQLPGVDDMATAEYYTMIGVQMSSAVLAGITSAGVTAPLDLIKTRIQVARRTEGQASTFTSVAREVLKEGGWTGLFRAAGPRMLSSALFSTAMTAVYETLKRVSVKSNAAV
ncbi:hypothetical protein CEUSTIGMA_g6092.t1 [Chlamydomonas eustigma]|uniref:Uncharacterized protein n=1 Tax=Chlamydomonas eustigma TaxID=1157962 RepID=A0A250X6E4_9CHLO|nr:hypothetical protein CEUSTIGMA_g6092.t1 [Chlamydomonas eustigma]|eukprot:GAX78654.1 hypothetical protein CEUSTIGMA_g6092.t1 [Chlamydomonas eustigma]